MNCCRKTSKLRTMLEHCFLFENTDAQSVDFALGHDGCEVYDFTAGEEVYSREDFRRSIGLVVSGFLRAAKISSDGTETLMASFGAGDVFGAAALFNEEKTYVSRIVSRRKSQVIFLSQALLRTLFSIDSRMAENYITYLSGRLCYLNRKIDGFTDGRAEARLARYLFDLSYTRDCADVTLPCSLTDLSHTLSIGRASLYRAMETLSDEQYIEREGKHIRILSLTGLKSLFT